jgi:hypothetical protein
MLGRQLLVLFISLDMHQKKPYVLVDGEWIDFSLVEFLNVSEDLFGFDIYEFIYKGKAYSSHAILK